MPVKRVVGRKIAQIKRRQAIDERTIVYTVLSSNGVDEYKTTFRDGKFAGCTCPARVVCYHAVQLQAREDALIASEPRPQPVHIPPVAAFSRPAAPSEKGVLSSASRGFQLMR